LKKSVLNVVWEIDFPGFSQSNFIRVISDPRFGEVMHLNVLLAEPAFFLGQLEPTDVQLSSLVQQEYVSRQQIISWLFLSLLQVDALPDFLHTYTFSLLLFLVVDKVSLVDK
jgi:hypothetical protein